MDGLNEAVDESKRISRHIDVTYKPRISIASDGDVPGQTLYRVLYTAGMARFSRFDFWGRSHGGEPGAIRITSSAWGATPFGRGSDEREMPCIQLRVAVGQKDVTVALEVEGRGRIHQRPSTIRTGRNPPSWDGRVLVGPDGECPTIQGSGLAEMARLSAAIDRIELGPLCGSARVIRAEGSVGSGRLLRSVAALRAGGEMETILALSKTAAARGSGGATCEATTDGRLNGGWTDRELRWLYSQKRAGFESLIAHLKRQAPLEEVKVRELARELDVWPVERMDRKGLQYVRELACPVVRPKPDFCAEEESSSDP